MQRQGLEFIDTDQHVGPNMETLHKFAGPRLLERWDELVPYFVAVTEGHHLSIDPIPYKRRLGTGMSETQAGGARVERSRSARRSSEDFEVKPAPEVNNENWKGRLEDMEREGVDVALIFPATFSTASTVLDVEMQNELYAPYHRYLDDYCGEHPDRLKAAALMNARDPEWSAAELRRFADRQWLCAVEVLLPEGMPVDDPSLAPIFEAMDEADLPFVHHSFYEPPLLPRLPRHLGQPRHRPHGLASLGRPAPVGLRDVERHVRPLSHAADRVRRVLRRGSAAG